MTTVLGLSNAMCDFLETPAKTTLTLALSPREKEPEMTESQKGWEGFAPLREATVYTQVQIASFASACAP